MFVGFINFHLRMTIIIIRRRSLSSLHLLLFSVTRLGVCGFDQSSPSSFRRRPNGFRVCVQLLFCLLTETAGVERFQIEFLLCLISANIPLARRFDPRRLCQLLSPCPWSRCMPDGLCLLWWDVGLSHFSRFVPMWTRIVRVWCTQSHRLLGLVFASSAFYRKQKISSFQLLALWGELAC